MFYSPIVRKIPSYVQETSDFFRKLEVPGSSYLITLDLNSLYTSISNSEVIKPVKICHENFTKKKIATRVITTFLAVILTLNYISNSKTLSKIQVVKWKLPKHHLT